MSILVTSEYPNENAFERSGRKAVQRLSKTLGDGSRHLIAGVYND
jgi:hypothetical protein